jgi:Rrf2 family iron-sulfur cluster assembly transcriptional regulator
VRLSAEATYALRAVFDIAYHDNGGPSKSDQIASREDIPPKFLEQILRKLKVAGLVESRRGPKGGYTLTKPPQEITVGAVVRAIEGKTAHGCCYETDDETMRFCTITSRCVTSATWRDLAEHINTLLETVTVADMVARGERFGLRRAGYQGFVYVI